MDNAELSRVTPGRETQASILYHVILWDLPYALHQRPFENVHSVYETRFNPPIGESGNIGFEDILPR